jgi:PadR family transcriptional regulator, regulatory protein AphA
MSIGHAILGFLSRRPLSGYDLKKAFADAEFVTWAGSNNQIYGTLLALQREGLVTSEVQQPERGPARKVYTLTERGTAELDTWLVSAPEPLHFRNAILLQLAWADRLPPEALDTLLAQYAHEVHMQLLMARERQRRASIGPASIGAARTAREAYLWQRIGDDWTGFYENELAWARQTREGLREIESGSAAEGLPGR